MPGINALSLYIPSGIQVEEAAKKAMQNIAKQLEKMPPVKKAASAADNFPGLYNNPADFKPLVLGQQKIGKAIVKKLNTESAIEAYRNVG